LDVGQGMTWESLGWRYRALRIAAAAAAFAAIAASASEAAPGLFTNMAGKWRGDGSLSWTTGEVERIRCQATYEVEGDGNKITQSLTCATDSTKLVVKSTITYRPAAGAIVGDWREATYGINGRVSGSASAGRIRALVQSGDKNFTARVTVVTRGREQDVLIRPENFNVTEVAVKLRKTG